jgi:cytochrome b
MTKQYLIWDLPVRLFHWFFVLTLLALWYTSEQDNGLIELHMKFGYVAFGLVIFRIIWGCVGTKHALFKHFLPSCAQLKNYLQQSRQGKAKNFAGHNPLGGLMVVFMLFVVLTQAGSGLFMNDDIFSAGPYSGVYSAEFDKVMALIHRNAFKLLALAAFVHVFAILYYLKVKKQNLIKPMLNGKKSADTVARADAISHSKLKRALLLAVIVAGFTYWLVVLNAPILEEYYY